ncbi:MAG: CBS domain-containing protein [Alphaproteobacteria bacterium]|nr:CBS domain-containing protein [Alphaproteobacteria bacterium]
MRAMDVMTTAVVTVSPDSTVQDLAKLLSERGISGVPVVENGTLVGIVSEGDLLRRAETGTERRTARRRWRWFDPGLEEARDYVKAHGQTVRHIMTREVISVDETADLAEVATLMETKRIKRVPVLRDGMLAAILSRANLVRALAAIGREPATGTAGSDREIRAKLLAELNGREWARVWPEEIVLQDGVVHLWISDARPAAEREALRVAAENVPGVRRIEEHTVPVPMFPPF